MIKTTILAFLKSPMVKKLALKLAVKLLSRKLRKLQKPSAKSSQQSRKETQKSPKPVKNCLTSRSRKRRKTPRRVALKKRAHRTLMKRKLELLKSRRSAHLASSLHMPI